MTKHPSEKNDNGFQRLGARLAKTTKRSAFASWLAQGQNYVRLKEQIDAHGVRWDEIAAWAFDEGYTGGQRITGIAAKRAFERQAARRDTPAKTKPKQRDNPVSVAPRPPPEMPPAAIPSGDARARFREQFKRSVIRKKPEE